jgi:hypothetical protein
VQAELPKKPRMSLTVPKSPLLQTKTRRFSRVGHAQEQEGAAYVSRQINCGVPMLVPHCCRWLMLRSSPSLSSRHVLSLTSCKCQRKWSMPCTTAIAMTMQTYVVIVAVLYAGSL